MRLGVGLRVALLVVVMVPLVGFAGIAASWSHQANRTADAAGEIRSAARRVSDLTSLQAAVYVENFWAGAVDAVDQIGLSPSVMEPVLGYDVAAELDGARSQVDALVDVGADTELDSLLTVARALGAQPNGDLGPYGRAERHIDDEIHAALDDLSEATTRVSDTSELAASAGVLVSSVDARRQVFLLVANLFGTRFPDQAVTADPRVGLVASQAAYRESWGRLRSLVGDDEPMAGLLDQVEADPRTVALLGSVDASVRSVLAPPSASPPDPSTALAVSDFTDALVVLDHHVQLVSDASQQVVDRSDEVAARAEDERTRVYVALGLVTAFTIATLAVVGRWIVGSIDGIAASANAMNEGDLDRSAPVRGPREVRAAAVALNSAASHLRSAEHQALALAGADLGADGAVPPVAVPGALGRSMQVAMASLADSLQEREELRRRLQHEALHDGLTGLPNRTSIVAGLEAAVRDRPRGMARVAVFFIDCDGFKLVNDQHGHAAGDRVLCAIADRILDSVRTGDLVGRLGGDEFVVVADPIDGEQEARALAGRIRAAVRRPIETEASVVTPAVSIGVALSGDDATPARLLHDADLAVYEAKALGSGTIEVCTDELRWASDDRQSVEVELRDAIETGRLRLHFQPIVDAGDERPVSVEALVRWPEGLVPQRTPGEFVAVAERSDLIVQLDRWVIERTIAVLGDRATAFGRSGAAAAVNLSARHASTRPFAAPILESLDRHAVAPERLVVELTESALLANVEHVVSELRQLRDRGVCVAIDDFGSGYTSLSLLHRLPVDELKLDRAMTMQLARPEVAAVVRLIVDTAHLIGLSVVAEGVETREQADELVALGVDQLQGFLFAHPMPLDDLPAMERPVAAPRPT
jgi:diguanylate cyclase (GGDEF)-like protein